MKQPLSFVVLSTGLDTFKELRAALASDDRTRLLAGGDDVEQLYPEVQKLKPNAAIIALGNNPNTAIALIERMAAECPETTVISAARDASPDLILRSMRAGARDFLRMPIIPEEFRTVVTRTQEHVASQATAPKKKGRLVAVFSSKGGCGTTFIATNLAGAMPAPTVLVDLNLQAGDLPLFLGVEPKYSIGDVVEARARLDEALLSTYITPHSSNLSLLAAPREADTADEIEPEHVFDALERLREKYDFVVLDPQHTFDAITLAALDQADDIVLVLTLDIPAIRSAQRALEIFDRLGYPRKKVRIVVNRFSKQIDLDLHQVERFLGERVAGFITSDYQTAVNSINLGQPLVHSEPNSKIAHEIRRVAAAIAGVEVLAEVDSSKKSIWNSLFKKNEPAASARLNPASQEILKPSITR
jgi:pilus assembly protein CpaE